MFLLLMISDYLRKMGHGMEYISTKERKIISDILARFLQCTRNVEIYSYNLENPFDDLYLQSSFHRINEEQSETSNQLIGQVVCIYDDKSELTHEVVEKYRDNNYLVILHEDISKQSENKKEEEVIRRIAFDGLALFKNTKYRKDTFKVLAIVHVYNEEDVVRKVTEYLLTQGLDVYLVDNWSSDSSYSIITDLVREHEGKVFCERFPQEGPTDYYDWYHQLQRSEELSYQLDYDWYIHYDADEYRISPWKDVTLRDAIHYIDSLGFNLIENTVIDFKITEKNDESIFMKDTWFDFGHRATHFEQIKTWKKCSFVDLKSSGGHAARVENPKIFPLKFLNRHYPLRSYGQAQKKIFVDRRPRFEKENKERGWHGHYNAIENASDIILAREVLQKWGKDTFDTLYVQLFTGVGIEIIGEKKEADFDIDIIDREGAEIVLYGAGAYGRQLYAAINEKNRILHWVDKDYRRIPAMQGRIIESPKVINTNKDIILIAVKNENVARDIEEELIQRGILRERIVWKKVRK